MPVNMNNSLKLNTRQANILHSQNQQSNKNINFAGSSLYGDDFDAIVKPDTILVATQTDFSDYSSNVNKIRKEIDSQKHSGMSKMILELSLTALVAATTIMGIKKGIDALQDVMKRVTNQGKNIATSNPVKQFFSNIRNLTKNSFSKVDKSLNNQAGKSKSFLLKSGVGIFNRLKDGGAKLFDNAGRLFKKAKNSENVKKAAKISLVDAPKIIASTCIGSFLTLTALENIIDPFMDKIFDKETGKKITAKEK